jgi:AcrR family transcriptional regulator
MEKIQSKREANKTQKRAAIIDAAAKLFLQRGYDSTSIDDVAKDSGFTKRTLYQYFISKEDLFYAVTLKAAKQLTAAYEKGFRQGGNALDKIRLANRMYLQFYKDYPEMFKLLTYTPSNPLNSEASPNYQELKKIDAIRMRYFHEVVEQGKLDGSINTGLDINKAVFFEFFTAFSLLSAASTSDGIMWNIMKLEESDFLQFCFDLLADAIK